MKSLDQIRSNGKRLTKPRKLIFEALSLFSKPATVQEINLYLKNKKISVDLTSIYRTLSLLTKMGMVYEIEFGEGKKRYEIVNEKKHHHHFVCDKCGTIKNIMMNGEKELIEKIIKKTNFNIKRHSMEFYGLCPKCC